ncbi:E3 ubiquitin-protein ligase Rnf220 isoform X3 [Parasteatoda tepidariorum]|uniref:E3 ubiquitin-protein ligase Rnf220 isoform X3 n=1 Tax=Parasteatoda tepidariorum TaxID=114398 RepID=UPI00077FC5A6|nr:E3 ubiquitin-protein ligase Rnf220 isoform X3 [Parasteatoda tepidariorum]
MSSHDRFRSRTGLFPQALKFPSFQELCLENSAYLPNAMTNPAVMVLNSTCGGNVTPHAQSHVTFARHPTGGRIESGKESIVSTAGAVPFPNPAFPVRPLFGQGDPYHLLSLQSLHHPALLASHALGRSYLNAGAFRPLAGLTDDRNGPFHGSAFMPAKCMKLDSHSPGSDISGATQPLLLGNCFPGSGSESSFHQSPANSTGSSLGQTVGSFLDGKDDRGDSDSMADGADRMSETPNLSEESRSIERSTPEDRGTPKRHKKFYFEGGQTPFCPICGQALQLSDLASHFEMEVERLPEIRKCISQQVEVTSLHSPFSSPMCMVRKDDKGKPESRWETYQRVKSNRTTRLTSARCMIKRKKWDDPNCTERSPEENLHMMPGLRKRESPETSIDSRTAAELNWAMSARMHAIAAVAFQRNLSDFARNHEDENQELNVDEDDSAVYGQPHYTEADVITCSSEDNVDSKEQIRRIQSNDSDYQRHSDSTQWTVNGGNNNNGEGQEVTSTCVTNNDAGSECVSPSEKASKPSKDTNSDNPKEQMEDGIKCLICMETFIKPVVSICCWHVHCEECWLKTLGTKKLCPQCNMITAAKDLRRIYL